MIFLNLTVDPKILIVDPSNPGRVHSEWAKVPHFLFRNDLKILISINHAPRLFGFLNWGISGIPRNYSNFYEVQGWGILDDKILGIFGGYPRNSLNFGDGG